MGYTSEQLINIAEAEVGYLEKASENNLDDKTANAGPNNWNKYARDLHDAGYYNGDKNGYSWCDVFVDWCHYIASGKNANEAQRVICQTGPLGAGCSQNMKYYKSANRFFEAPLPGDQIFFDWQGDKSDADHTGIVYKVNETTVYTIEGNTGPIQGLEDNGDGVYKKQYSLSYKFIVGYGRPLYADAADTTAGNNNSGTTTSDSTFIQNTEAVQSATKHNFFTVKLLDVFSTTATAKVSATDDIKYTWSYELTDLVQNTKVSSGHLDVTNLNNIQLAGLTPYRPYALKISADSGTLLASQQVFFSTLQDIPEAIKAVTATFDDAILLDKSCRIVFNPPNFWGDFGANRSKGYRVSLVKNGGVVASSDDLLKYNSASTMYETITLKDFLKLNKDIILDYGDTIQIGVQTWIKSENNEIILSNHPTYSQPFFIKHNLNTIVNTYISTANDFKHSILWLKR
jgi:hypothetical protein